MGLAARLVAVGFEEAQEGFGDDEARGGDGLGGDVGDLQQRGAREVHRLHHLEVDVHVERHLPPPLQLLLLGRLLLVPARGELR